MMCVFYFLSEHTFSIRNNVLIINFDGGCCGQIEYSCHFWPWLCQSCKFSVGFLNNNEKKYELLTF